MSTNISPVPSQSSTISPTDLPTHTAAPSLHPSGVPTERPTTAPTEHPSLGPTSTVYPSSEPSPTPSKLPSKEPSDHPSENPTLSLLPSLSPSSDPSKLPSRDPSGYPTTTPSLSSLPSLRPSSQPSFAPSVSQQPSLSILPSSSPTNFDPNEDPNPLNAADHWSFADDTTSIPSIVVYIIFGVLFLINLIAKGHKKRLKQAKEKALVVARMMSDSTRQTTDRTIPLLAENSQQTKAGRGLDPPKSGFDSDSLCAEEEPRGSALGEDGGNETHTPIQNEGNIVMDEEEEIVVPSVLEEDDGNGEAFAGDVSPTEEQTKVQVIEGSDSIEIENCENQEARNADLVVDEEASRPETNQGSQRSSEGQIIEEEASVDNEQESQEQITGEKSVLRPTKQASKGMISDKKTKQELLKTK